MRGLALEFVVIVVGVLLALGVDRWSQGLDDRRLEQDYLRRVEADLVADSAMLVDRLEIAATGLERVRELRVAIDTMSESYLPAGETILAVAGGPGFAPQAATTTFDELMSTGNLTLLRDESVRIALLEYYRQSEALSANADVVMRRGREPWMEAAVDAGAVMPLEERGTDVGLWVSADLPRLLRRVQQFHGASANFMTAWQRGVEVALEVVRAARTGDPAS